MEDSFSILVVDDEPPQLELIGGFLKKQGFEVALAESGERALQRFRQESFDLVLNEGERVRTGAGDRSQNCGGPRRNDRGQKRGRPGDPLPYFPSTWQSGEIDGRFVQHSCRRRRTAST